PLEPKVFQTLLYLVRNRGRLIEKDELMREIWPDRFVEETNLARNISVLRKTLGKDQNGCHYIETAARRGYRFVGSVKTVVAEDLAKEPDKRLQTGHDLMREVKWVADSGSDASAVSTIVVRGENRGRLAWIAGGVLLLALLAALPFAIAYLRNP